MSVLGFQVHWVYPFRGSDIFERWEPFRSYRCLDVSTNALYRGVPGCLQRLGGECEVGKQNVRACQYFAVQVGMYTCVEFGRLGCTCIILNCCWLPLWLKCDPKRQSADFARPPTQIGLGLLWGSPFRGCASFATNFEVRE